MDPKIDLDTLRIEATELARAKGHFLDGWQPHKLGWGSRCTICGLFVLVAHRIYGLSGDGVCWGEKGGGPEIEECEPIDDIGILMEKLTDEEQQGVLEEATNRFFNKRLPGLEGHYAILNFGIVRGEATDDQMKIDALRFGIDPLVYAEEWRDLLMEQLEERFDEELYDAMLRAVESEHVGQPR